MSGLTLLQACVGWWDPATYSGSGNLVNSGTGGSSLDLVLGATTAAPSFSVDHFTFDGVDDYMGCNDNSQLDFALTDNYTAGIIVKYTNTPNSFGCLLGKRTSGTGGYQLLSNGTTYALYYSHVDSVGNSVSVTSAATSINTKVLFAAVRNVTSDTITAYLNGTAGTPDTDTSTATSDNAQRFEIGRVPGPSNYQRFDMYGAFVHRGVLTASDLADISGYYIPPPTITGTLARTLAALTSTATGTTGPVIARPYWGIKVH